MFRYLINDNVIPGNWLCLALFSQGVLKNDPQARAGLAMGDSAYTYNFIKSKISNLELTPAQLALDPCTAGCVVTDVRTGEIRALVSIQVMITTVCPEAWMQLTLQNCK